MENLRILIIGEMPPPDGGVTVLLKILVEELSCFPEVKTIIVDITSPRHRKSFFGRIRILEPVIWAYSTISKIVYEIRSVDIVTLHVVTPKLYIAGLITLFFSRLFKKPLIIRKFAGTNYNDYRPPKKYLTRWVLKRCDLYLTETKALMKIAENDEIRHQRWFPNHRPMPVKNVCNIKSRPCCKFVYLGAVRLDKGIRELIKAAEKFKDEASVDIYGPFFDGLAEKDFSGLSNVQYRGVLQPKEVYKTLCSYDALILPTYHEGEGHPGVILEAHSAGLPVITTNWRSVPEIVTPDCGILVEPRDFKGLYRAMKQLCDDPNLFVNLQKGARERASQFSSNYWAAKFVEYCRSVVPDDKLVNIYE